MSTGIANSVTLPGISFVEGNIRNSKVVNGNRNNKVVKKLNDLSNSYPWSPVAPWGAGNCLQLFWPWYFYHTQIISIIALPRKQNQESNEEFDKSWCSCGEQTVAETLSQCEDKLSQVFHNGRTYDSVLQEDQVCSVNKFALRILIWNCK